MLRWPETAQPLRRMETDAHVAEEGGFDYEAVLAACARGETAALRLLYDRDAPRLLGVAMRIVRQIELAEDVVHDAFVQIWRGARTFDPARGAGRTWVYSVLRHRALNAVRARGREVLADSENLARMTDIGPNATLAAELAADAPALRRCLEALTGEQRDSILLAYLQGFSHGQIARQLNAPLGTVKSWIRRGLDALRRCLE